MFEVAEEVGSLLNMITTPIHNFAARFLHAPWTWPEPLHANFTENNTIVEEQEDQLVTPHAGDAFDNHLHDDLSNSEQSSED